MDVAWHEYTDENGGNVPVVDSSIAEKASIIGRVGIMFLSCGTGAWSVRSSMNTLGKTIFSVITCIFNGHQTNILRTRGVLALYALPDTCKLGMTEAQAYAVVWDAFQKIQEEAPRAMVFYGQETGLKKENPDKPYDEIGILLPIHEFEKKMLQHLDEIDGIVLACREKMMEKAGNDSLQL